MMMDALDTNFDDHPSLDASLEDFEHPDSPPNRSSPIFGLPSQHSGFRDDYSDEGTDNGEEVVNERWSPPGLRRFDPVHGSSWYRHQPYLRDDIFERFQLRSVGGLGPSQSREASPQFEDALEMPMPILSKSDTGTEELTVADDASGQTGTTGGQTGRDPSPAPTHRTDVTDDALEFGGGQLSNCRFSVLPLYTGHCPRVLTR